MALFALVEVRGESYKAEDVSEILSRPAQPVLISHKLVGKID